ncbi:MAG: O-antigen ligase family protein [Deferribacteres bacterium]|nr:O-antigen ligase family protein [candidate division KSB1 bacterium]MCB9503373.1 O-antigen ligase family protein [Deferribacteres bacterium]
MLFLVGLFYVFPTGFIFYHYTGILLVDFPLIALLFLSLSSGKKFKFYYPGYSPAILVLIVWMTFSSFQAIDVGWGIAQVSKWVRGYLIFIVVANNVRGFKSLNTVLFSLLTGFLFESLLAAYHWRVGPLGLWFLGERMFQSEPWRSYGTFYVPSYLANYLIVLLPLFMRLGVYFKQPNRNLRLLYFVTTLLGVLALYTTYGRSSWIGFTLAVAISTAVSLFSSKLKPKLKWPLVSIIVGGASFIIYYIPYIIRQFGAERQGAVDIRYIQWDVALRLIADNPLFGSGPDNYTLFAGPYTIPMPGIQDWLLTEMVHNSYLLITAEGGIIPGIAFLILLFNYFLKGLPLLKSKSPLLVNVGLGMVLGIVSIMFSFIASPDIHNEQMINQLMIIAGIIVACYHMNMQINRAAKIKKSQQPGFPRQMSFSPKQ